MCVSLTFLTCLAILSTPSVCILTSSLCSAINLALSLGDNILVSSFPMAAVKTLKKFEIILMSMLYAYMYNTTLDKHTSNHEENSVIWKQNNRASYLLNIDKMKYRSSQWYTCLAMFTVSEITESSNPTLFHETSAFNGMLWYQFYIIHKHQFQSKSKITSG